MSQRLEISLSVRPITSWPWPVTHPSDRRRAPFTATWSATSSLLIDEARARKAPDLILELDVGDRDVRRDGWIREDARPMSPRTVVTFEDRQHGWVRYHGDRYWQWQDNARAIALSLQALRAMDRYGVTTGEQYAGFRTGRALPGKVLNTREAAALLARQLGRGDGEIKVFVAAVMKDPAEARSAVLQALKRAHPDHGGTGELLYQVSAARDVLRLHHGVEL